MAALGFGLPQTAFTSLMNQVPCHDVSRLPMCSALTSFYCICNMKHVSYRDPIYWLQREATCLHTVNWTLCSRATTMTSIFSRSTGVAAFLDFLSGSKMDVKSQSKFLKGVFYFKSGSRLGSYHFFSVGSIIVCVCSELVSVLELHSL